MFKICISCEVEKPLSEFYTHPTMKDGYLGKCKTCHLKACKEARQNRIDEIRERDRNRGRLPHRLEANRRYAKTEEGRAAKARAKAAWIERNKNKQAAHRAVTNALRRGLLIRSEYCERCREPEKLQGHHPDYARPLEVLWLCDACHKQIHREEREAKRLPSKKPVGSVRPFENEPKRWSYINGD